MPVISVSDAVIVGLSSERDTTFVTITYREEGRGRGREQTVVLVAGSRTLILNSNGIPIPAALLRIGMTVSATFSSAMTRSNPPQATAFLIRITGRGTREETTRGTILNVDRRNRSFIMSRERDFSNRIQMNVNEDTRIFDCGGRQIRFSDLREGMEVRVRHANFMTASIPPQTTAFEIEVQCRR
ncbi:MAG: hypothetical protein IJP31_03470 [Lachnospiraceae bacterium]|nr:hypothetical protein [Lachnospiraceae bacterium]